MSDFVQYILGEVKARRLSREEGLDLLRQFRKGVSPSKWPATAPDSSEAGAASPATEVVQWIPIWDPIPEPDAASVPRSEDSRVLAISIGASSGPNSFAIPVVGSVRIPEGATIEDLVERLRVWGPVSEVLWVADTTSVGSEGTRLATATAELVCCFQVVKALIQLGYDRRNLTWTLLTRQTQALAAAEPVDPTHAGLHGFLGSLCQEFPLWNSRLLDLPPVDSDELSVPPLPLPSPDNTGNTRLWRLGAWYRSKLIRRKAETTTPPAVPTGLRAGGVYVVVGGAGGIGAAWTTHAIRQYRARVVWIGRRPLDATIEASLLAAESHGVRPEYIPADAGDPQALRTVCDRIRAAHGAVHGVIHSALVLSDATVRTMSEAQLHDSFVAKAAVAIAIGDVFERDALDFVLFFSSMMSFTRPAGQSNYTAGSVFADAQAAWLRRKLKCPVKVLHWAYWGESGSVAAPAYRERMAQAGLASLESKEAMPVLESLVAGPVDCLALAKLIVPVSGAKPTEPGERVSIQPMRAGGKPLSTEEGKAETATIDVLRERREESRLGELDLWVARLLAAQLSRIAGKAGLPEFLRLRAGVEARFHRWMEESVRLLGNDGLRAELEAPVWSADSVWSRWQAVRGFWVEREETAAHVRFFEAALNALPEILTGKRRATEVLFPDGSMELAEGVYRRNPVSDFFNETLADALCRQVSDHLASGATTPFRILEIGAGTGGTTAGLLQRLQPFGSAIGEYRFTDLSEGFLAHAKRQFGPAYPSLSFGILDISRPWSEQDLEPGRYDAVVATNVLHATADIRLALRHAKAALRRGGRLLVNEFVEKTAFTHVTFGLLDGWWLYADAGLRIPGCPGLSASSWRSVLHGEGFTQQAWPTSQAVDLGQQVVVAESDGVVRWEAPRSLSAESPRTVPHGTQPTEVGAVEPGSATPGTRVDMEAGWRDALAGWLSDSLKMDREEINDDVSFADFGLDSLTGVRFVQTVSQALGIEITTTELFDHPTLGRLTHHLLKRAPKAVEQWLRGSGAGEAIVDRKSEENPRPVFGTELPDGETVSIPSKSAIQGPGPNPSPRSREPIAIIGMSGRYAGSDSLEDLWRHLAAGDSLVRTATRWNLSQVLSDTFGRDFVGCTAGSFLDRIDEFDPTFFNISGTEAAYMDPQQRLFLEECWKALEDAGYAGNGLRGKRCGVYVGCNQGDYKEVLGSDLPPQAMWGNSNSVVPARIAYFLDLRGPAVAVDTACSSSLVAMHLACQGLWSGETDMALAGGVFIQSTPMFYIAANRAGMLSASGLCHTFDAGADGFVPGEGVGVVVLKRLEDALRDRDEIHAVIEGSGINQDGATNGVTAPSAESQERLERSVYESFGINADSLSLVEAHGTGTRLGDPIEFEALSRAFRFDTARTGFCALGSVKTNVGHATAAAGVTGLLKVVLALKHRQIPPSLHFVEGNPAIRFEGSPFYVNTELKPWVTAERQPRRAALSAFGFSGTNAHCVIREAPGVERRRVGVPAYPLLLSARSLDQLRLSVERLVTYWDSRPDLDVADVAFTLQFGRRHLEHRVGLLARDREHGCDQLRRWLRGEPVEGVVSGLVDRRKRREQAPLKGQAEELVRQARVSNSKAGFETWIVEALKLQVSGLDVSFEALFDGLVFHQ